MKTAGAPSNTHDKDKPTYYNKNDRPLAHERDALGLHPSLNHQHSANVSHNHEPEHKRTQGRNTSANVNDPWTTPLNLTSQCCRAVSIDTCTAVVRFLSWIWSHTSCMGDIPPRFCKTRTLGHGYRFSGV